MTRRGVLLFAAMCVIWGIPYLLIRVAVRELTPVTLVFARTGIAAILLVPVAALRGELRLAPRRWTGLLIGIAGVAAIVGLDVHGVGVLPPLEIGVVAVSYAVGPIVLARW